MSAVQRGVSHSLGANGHDRYFAMHGSSTVGPFRATREAAQRDLDKTCSTCGHPRSYHLKKLGGECRQCGCERFTS